MAVRISLALAFTEWNLLALVRGDTNQ